MVMFRSRLNILVLLLFNSLFLQGQIHEFGFFAGGSYYMGELNPSIPFLQTQPAGGLIYRRNLNKRYSLKTSLLLGRVSASDANYSGNFNDFRAISFSSYVFEFSEQVEFNFFPYRTGKKEYPMSPYVFIGVGVFAVNPHLEYHSDNSFNDINDPSQTNTKGISVPFGLGIKSNLIGNMGFSIEWGMRKTLSDRIDGLADNYENKFQKSYSETEDWYSFVGLILNYKFNSKAKTCSIKPQLD